MDRARRLELNVLCKGDGGEVVAQDPDPGVAMGRDEVVRLYLSGAPPSAPHTTPDLRGLPMRVAKRKAVLAGLRCTVVGTGLVASQKPAPGTVSASGTVKIYCRNAATAQRKS
jgi:beta-lactam-binding protein with PASTA domain